jgi:hypothetical protein
VPSPGQMGQPASKTGWRAPRRWRLLNRLKHRWRDGTPRRSRRQIWYLHHMYPMSSSQGELGR